VLLVVLSQLRPAAAWKAHTRMSRSVPSREAMQQRVWAALVVPGSGSHQCFNEYRQLVLVLPALLPLPPVRRAPSLFGQIVPQPMLPKLPYRLPRKARGRLSSPTVPR
jgi:hypothetical protein